MSFKQLDNVFIGEIYMHLNVNSYEEEDIIFIGF